LISSLLSNVLLALKALSGHIRRNSAKPVEKKTGGDMIEANQLGFVWIKPVDSVQFN